MALKNKTNDELFALYDAELILKVHNTRNLENDRRLLAKFHSYLNGSQPSPELAKGSLSQFSGKKRGTLARYAATIKSFMKWCGEPMDNFRIKVPRSLPPYTEDSDIKKVFAAAENKKTHKGCIVRDRLLLTIAFKTGMRRAELAILEPKDIHADFLIAHGKGGKTRMIPLSTTTAQQLHNFIEGMEPDEKVLKLKATTISNKITRLSQKAGLNGFHTHLLRHKT